MKFKWFGQISLNFALSFGIFYTQYDFHVFELRDEEISAEKIITVK